MKLNKNIFKAFLFILFCLTLNFQIRSDVAMDQMNMPDQMSMDPGQMDKLTEMAKKMLDTLPPEEQEKIIQEAIAMEENLKKLPPEEKSKMQKNIDDAVNFILSDDFPIDDILKEQEQKTAEEIKAEEVKTEEIQEKEEKQPEPTPVGSGDTKCIKSVLEQLNTLITSLLNKVICMPRVSNEKATEEKWTNLRPMVVTIEKALKIIVKKEKLLGLLVSQDYVSLKSNFEALKNELNKKVEKLNPPDTAGLTILFDEEEEDNIEFTSAQKQLKEIINILENIIITKNLFNDLRNFFEKNAPEELKNNPEIAKGLEVQAPNNNYQNQQNYNYGGNYGGGYGPYMGGYGPYPIMHDASDSSSSGGHSRNMPGANGTFDKNKKGPDMKKAADEKGKGAGKPDSKKDEKKPEEKKEDGKKNEKSDGNSIKSQINDFSRSLEEVSQSLEKNKIPEMISQKLGRKIDQPQTKNPNIQAQKPGALNPIKPAQQSPAIQPLSKKQTSKIQKKEDPLKEIQKDYDKSLKIIMDIEKSMKKLDPKSKKAYENVIKETYARPEYKLEKTFKQYGEIFQNLENQVSDPEVLDKKLSENPEIMPIVEKHAKLRKMVGIKDPQEEQEKKEKMENESNALIQET